MSPKNNPIKYFFILGNNPALSLAEIFGLLNSGDKDFRLAGVSPQRTPARQGCHTPTSESPACGRGDSDGAPSQNFNLHKNARIITFCKDFLIIELDKKIDANKLMGVLGGTIKIGIILESQNANIETRDLIEKINIDKNKKFYFGFSAYGKIGANFKRLAMEIKKKLKQDGTSSRWVISREKQLSSVVVKKNKLVGENGTEFCVLKNKDKIFWGKTLAVQEFEDYGQRDFYRPARDPKSGMIPPKLANMMINLARAELDFKTKNGITLLDPFCGSGTILQEAAILGINKIIGSDLSEKATRDSEQNLKWLEERIDISPQSANGKSGIARIDATTSPHAGKRLNTPLDVQRLGREDSCAISIFNSDVRKISELIPAGSVDLIVAEPYLGPPLSGGENENRISQIVQELSELYLSAFKEFKKILKKDGCICMVWPVFAICKKNIFLPILGEVEKLGFRQVRFDSGNYVNLIFDGGCKTQFAAPAPQSPDGRLRRSTGNDGDELKNFKKNLADNFSERGNIVYGRDRQIVKREIAIFKI
ncbi:MAG: hypothetical protein ABIC82_01240 [bacterium]